MSKYLGVLFHLAWAGPPGGGAVHPVVTTPAPEVATEAVPDAQFNAILRVGEEKCVFPVLAKQAQSVELDLLAACGKTDADLVQEVMPPSLLVFGGGAMVRYQLMTIDGVTSWWGIGQLDRLALSGEHPTLSYEEDEE